MKSATVTISSNALSPALSLSGQGIMPLISLQNGDFEEEEDILVLEERKLGKDWGTIENRWIIFKDGKKYEYSFSHKLYSAVELSNLLQECGFKRVDVYGDFGGSPYDHRAKRLILVACK